VCSTYLVYGGNLLASISPDPGVSSQSQVPSLIDGLDSHSQTAGSGNMIFRYIRFMGGFNRFWMLERMEKGTCKSSHRPT
jgi:hypothetical protein